MVAEMWVRSVVEAKFAALVEVRFAAPMIAPEVQVEVQEEMPRQMQAV